MVTVSNACNHGLNVGDKIDVTEVTCASSACSFAVSTSLRYRESSMRRPSATRNSGGNKTGEGYYTQHRTCSTIPSSRAATRSTTRSKPVESCTDAALTAPATARHGQPLSRAGAVLPQSPTTRNRLDTPTGKEPTNTKARCRKKYEEASGYIYPRYGQFRRVDITSQRQLRRPPAAHRLRRQADLQLQPRR